MWQRWLKHWKKSYAKRYGKRTKKNKTALLGVLPLDPVRAVEIPKSDGSKRLLGIPTVSDRVAQAVVKSYLEPILEPKFHEDSYGYRPGKSALDAVGVARERCWRQNWCIDLDIKGFFDNLDHELMMKAIKFHTNEKWIHLYVERWLKASLQLENGTLIKRECGTPQGGLCKALHNDPYAKKVIMQSNTSNPYCFQ